MADQITPPQLYDTQGKPLNLPEDEAHQALLSGKAGFQAGAKVPVIDADGKLGVVDSDSLADELQRGAKLAPGDAISQYNDKKEYGDGLGNELIAGAAGAARGATLGLSDQALTKSGLVNPETLKKYEHYNPGASTVGEIAGAFAPIIASGGAAAPEEGASLLAKVASYAPSAKVAELGGAISEGVASRFASEGTKSLASRIAESTISKTAGSAIEGAIYGAGQSVSEDALGDHNALGEKLFANVGMGALIGGGLGGVIGAAEGAASGLNIPSLFKRAGAGAPESVDPVAQGDVPVIATPKDATLESAVDVMGLSPEKKASIAEGLTQLKGNSQEIIDAAKTIGAPVLESQVSASKHIQDIDSMILNSPTPVGVARQQLYKSGINAAEKAVGASLGEGSELSVAEVGDQLKHSLSQKISAQSEPISELYNNLKEHYQTIPLNERSIKQIARNIRNLEDVDVSPQAASMAEDFASRLEKLETVEQVKRLKTTINQELPGIPSVLQKRVVGLVAEKLTNLEENSVIRFAEENARTPKAKEAMLSLLDQREAANTAYKALKDKMANLSDVLGGRKIQGPQDFLNYIDEITPEKFAGKLFAKNNSEFLRYFAKEFPDEFKLLAQQQKSVIREAATKDGVIQVNKVLAQLKKMSPELKSLMFEPHELERLNAARTYMESMPANINPSGTSKSEAYRRFFEKPISAAAETLRDVGGLSAIKRAVNITGGDEAPKIMTLIRLEQMAQDASRTVKNSVGSFIKSGASVPIAVGAAGAMNNKPASLNYLQNNRLDKPSADRSQKSKGEAFGKRFNEISNFISDPSSAVDTVSKSLSGLTDHAPKTAQAVAMTAMNAAQFLYAKAPKDRYASQALNPALRKWRPSDAEISKWERYVQTVDNPMGALKDLQHGKMAVEQAETLKSVFPSIYSEVVGNLVEHLSELKEELPFKKRLQISTLFGVPVEAATNPQFLAMLQQQHMASAQEQQPNAGANPRAHKANFNKNENGFSLAQNHMTDVEQTLS